MIACESGDVVLVRFPFTDLASTKQRPALVVSPVPFSAAHGDVVVLALTSQDQHDTQLSLDLWEESGLLKPTWIKPVIGTLSEELVVRRLGHISKPDGPKVIHAMKLLIASRFLPLP